MDDTASNTLNNLLVSTDIQSQLQRKQQQTTPVTLCAWIYPGAPAYSANDTGSLNPRDMYRQHKMDMLRAQYFNVNDNGTLAVVNEVSTDLETTANGYSRANVADLKKYSSQQYTTVSGGYPGIQALWSSPTNVNTAVQTLVTFVTENGITGVDIDFENFGQWTAADYIAFKQFVLYLGNELHARAAKLILCGPTWTGASNPFPNWNYGDFKSLPVDYISPMTYDYQWDFGGGAPISPLAWLTTWAKTMLAIFPADKLILGLPSYGYTATVNKYNIQTKTYNQILAAVPKGGGGATRDSSSGELMLTTNGTVWVYNDSTSLDMKRAALVAQGIQMISVWHLGGNLWFTE